MFGYVRPPAHDLSPENLVRFRQMYCGLCHTLRQRYGFAGRWILNYDFTFLAILLSGRTDFPATAQSAEGEPVQSVEICPYTVKKRRCMAHPLRPRTYLESTPVMELAADESVILTWWKLCDNVTDNSFPGRIPAQGACAFLRGAYHKAAGRRPEFDRTVQFQLGRLREMERAKVPSLDIPADAFAQILRGAADEQRIYRDTDNKQRTHRNADDEQRTHRNTGDEQRIYRDAETERRITGHILYHLGRWIYLIDAADDLAKDAKTGNYNPVALRYGLRDGRWTPSAREEFVLTLDASIHQMTAAFELWDFGVWTPVLRETLYRGLFQTGRAVLDGTFHTRPECFHMRPVCGQGKTVPRPEYGQGKTFPGSECRQDKTFPRPESVSTPELSSGTLENGTMENLSAGHTTEESVSGVPVKNLPHSVMNPDDSVMNPDSGNRSGEKRGESVDE